MPPQIALIVYIFIILFLIVIELKKRSNVSPAIWIPTIWMAIIASRPLSMWLYPGDTSIPADVLIEGIPFDRNVFLILLISGLFILSRRSISWSQLVKNNVWLFLLFFYFGISILWSDFPFVSFKRWIKQIGNLTMILILLSDPDPVEAIKAMIKRCAYILIPLSILLIKYYPHLGIGYDPWTGLPSICGVTWNKNSLGYLCLVLGFFFFWSLLTIRRQKGLSNNKGEVFLHIMFLLMITWLLIKADSATSLISLMIGIAVLAGLGLPMIKRNLKNLGTVFFLSVFIFLILQFSFNIIEIVIGLLGRDITLTSRTFIWQYLYGMDTNPLIGTGFESFWLGDRLSTIWQTRFGHINEAHNGYLEIYLNSGLVGLFLLIGVILSDYKNILKTLKYDFDYGRFQMAFLIIAIIYNITESAFRGFHLVWFMFLLISVSLPGRYQAPSAGNGFTPTASLLK